MITNDELTRLIADARNGAKHPVDVDFVAEISRAHARGDIGCLDPFDIELLEDLASSGRGYDV